MSQNTSKIEHSESEIEPTLLRQQSDNETSLNGAFDGISVLLVSLAVIIGSVLIIDASYSFLPLSVQGNPILITIALISAVFTLLSVRESKLDREAGVAPTLFVAERETGEYGIVNLGSGAAHDISVKATTATGNEGTEIKSKCEGEILPVSDFLVVEEENELKRVEMSYRSNLGKDYDSVTREILSDDD